jgi:UDP-3-O-[3-hydroxymyristoyl] glucosamine N-acyltransferase
VKVGNGVMMGGQVGIADHVQVGDGAALLAKTGLMDNAPPKTQWAGYPARTRIQWLRIEAALNKLPNALKFLRQLERRLEELEKSLKPKSE